MTAPLSHGEGALRFRARLEQLRGPIKVERVLCLPAIAPGQLRCQSCAGGIPAGARFCADCIGDRATDATRKPCRECQTPFVPSRAHPTHCRLCSGEKRARQRPSRAKLGAMRSCLTCGADTPRTPGRPKKDCEACRA